MKVRRTKSFTLVELLVVMSVIAVLVALLLPSLRNAQENAKQAHCMNNLRQVGVILKMYAADNQGWLPDGDWGESINMGLTDYVCLWLKSRYGLKDELVWCPSAASSNLPPSGAYSHAWYRGWRIGYLAYYYLGGYGDSDHPSAWYGWYTSSGYMPLWSEGIGPTPNLHLVSNHARRPLMWDISYDSTDLINHYWYKPPRSNHANVNGTARGQNMLFVDGHVEWRPLREGVGQKFGQDYYDLFYW